MQCVSSVYLSSFGEPVPSADSCSWLTEVETHVI